MKRFSKWILSALCAVFAFVGVATLQKGEEVTASAAAATEYEVVDSAIMATIHNEYIPNGNFSLYIIIPELDMGGKTGSVEFPYDLSEEFNKLGLFDKVKIAGKTLREYGCTTFYNKYALGINEKPTAEVPHNHIRLYCHADPVIWETAYNAGEWNFSSDVTIEEGALFPGYAYLSGGENATLYRAGCTFVKTTSNANYGMTSYGETDVESMDDTVLKIARPFASCIFVKVANVFVFSNLFPSRTDGFFAVIKRTYRKHRHIRAIAIFGT